MLQQLVHFLESLQQTLQGMGWLGVLAYAGIFVAAQLFMIPVALALDAFARQQFPGVSRATLTLGVVSLSFIILCESLFIVNVVADDLYTVPQGALPL